MIIHMDGDLLKVQKDMNIDVICHQVNCQGKMASGIAKQIRETYPVVYENYMAKYKAMVEFGTHIMLGDIQLVPLYEDFYQDVKHQHVCNMFAQNDFGYDGRRYTSYDAFWICLNRLRETLPAGSTIGFPYLIGCDRGGANWNVIEAMIKEVFNNEYVVYIVHYDGGK